MRWLLAVVLSSGACRHFQADPEHVQLTEEQRWDEFCKNPPTTDDWRDWCARRTQQRQFETQQQMLQAQQTANEEQREENERAEKHRRFERSQAVWKASQAPWQPQN